MDIDNIIIEIISGEKISEKKQELFNQWYSEPENKQEFIKICKSNALVKCAYKPTADEKIEAWSNVNAEINEIGQNNPQSTIGRRNNVFKAFIKYAAILLIPICLSIIAYYIVSNKFIVETQVASNIVKPGSKQAILTLSTGENLSLTEEFVAKKEQIEDVVIHNTQSQLSYNQTQTKSVKEIYNTINVPRGGEYSVVLADGTTVFLNSESKLVFPVTFKGDLRKVKLEGEAYFRVAHNKDKPFIVDVGDYNVKVTGTEFNVRNYKDQFSRTTLIEGGVEISYNNKIQKLIPGEQASIENGKINVNRVDVKEEIAWYNNEFLFVERKLEYIMNELARWYDINVFYYNEDVKDLHFTAWFSRSSSIEEVMKILEKTNIIKVKLKNQTLTIQQIYE